MHHTHPHTSSTSIYKMAVQPCRGRGRLAFSLTGVLLASSCLVVSAFTAGGGTRHAPRARARARAHAGYHQHRQQVQHSSPLNNQQHHSDETNTDTSGANDDAIDNNRRHFISAPAPAFMALILSQQQPAASAYSDENLLELDQKKIVMQMSSQNIPRKYSTLADANANANANAQAINTQCSGSGASSSMNNDLTESEMRRIAVFEKAAPSVVYIDTFVEQRDAFSTNVMEVPIGTGSGFVWDDKGHIVTNCKCCILHTFSGWNCMA